ncbi:MAG: hypothetical protein ACLRWQ_14165 [Flavonifractor plautii]
MEYRFYDLRMELENAPRLHLSAPEGITQLNVTGTVTVEVPLSLWVRPSAAHADHHEASTPNMFPGFRFCLFRCLAVSHSAKKCLCVSST